MHQPSALLSNSHSTQCKATQVQAPLAAAAASSPLSGRRRCKAAGPRGQVSIDGDGALGDPISTSQVEFAGCRAGCASYTAHVACRRCTPPAARAGPAGAEDDSGLRSATHSSVSSVLVATVTSSACYSLQMR